MEIIDYKLARNMKYEALYWSLGYEEVDKDIYLKKYQHNYIIINAQTAEVNLLNKITVLNKEKFILDNHKSFVILECLDKLLMMGYSPNEIILDFNNEFDIYLNSIYIKCFEWNKVNDDIIRFKSNKYIVIYYESRLVSGLIERRTKIKGLDDIIYDNGLFEEKIKKNKYIFSNIKEINDNDFIIKNGVVTSYLAKKSIVIIPEGVISLASGLFWDNQVIEEVILPNSLMNLGGDTFYNCFNLKKLIITENVEQIGNNPFAGCPNLELINSSKHFNYENDTLYTKDYKRLIYHKINSNIKSLKIKYGTKIIGKHSFYLCKSLEKLEIPSTVIKLENNPFSGCINLDINNGSINYLIKDNVIYDKYINSVIGAISKINIDKLELLPVKRINRNAFWNCKSIKEIVLPTTLEDIGYNPFVGCDNIKFINKSNKFVVEDNILYDKNKTKLICCPANAVNKHMKLKESVITLERGAFSSCKKLETIDLHNVSVISKSCFTNCNNLKEVYCSDLVVYIGEWAFAHCKNLKNISCYKDCYIDKNVTLNTNAKISKRQERTNYLIESDNIYTLQSMQESYQNKIKAIIIDPPYNSNISYIEYKDNYNDYYKFMDDRINLAINLLKSDGFLVINIDKKSLKTIKKVCFNYFSKDLISIHKWEKLNKYFDINKEIKPNKKKVKYEYIVICKMSKNSKVNQIEQPYLKYAKLNYKLTEIPKTFKMFGTTSSAKDELAQIFKTRNYFSTPKPIKLIEELIRACTNKDDLVLDFFAGSGTTAVATILLNKQDSGNRKFIMVSNSENNICQNVTYKRLKAYSNDFIFIN